jgi:hypothetical protein
VTVFPGSEGPPPDRYVGQMPAGWTPTPLTAAQRAENMRRFAAEARERAEQIEADEAKYRPGRTGGADLMRARAADYERKAEQYDLLAQAEADRPADPEPTEPRPRRTFVIGG